MEKRLTSVLIAVRRATEPARRYVRDKLAEDREKRGLNLQNRLSSHPQVQSVGRGSYGINWSPRIKTYVQDARLTIGAFCSFAPNITILLGGEHRPDWVSQYPCVDRRFCHDSLWCPDW